MHAPVDRSLRDRVGFGEFVALVALMMGITAYGVDNTLPAFPHIAESFGVMDPNRLQLVVFVYMAAFGLFQLFYGPLSDAIGRRPAFLGGLAVFAVGSLISLVATDFTTLLAGRFIQGAGAAAGRVLAMAVVRDRFAGREMARVMSLTMMIFIMVPIFAPAIGSAFTSLAGWHAIFASMLVAAIGLGIWFAARMPETLPPEYKAPFSARRFATSLRETAGCRPALGYATGFGLLFGGIMGYVASSQQIFTEIYGLGDLFPLMFASIAFFMGAAALTNSRLVRRFGTHRISHGSMFAFLGVAAVQCVLAVATNGHPPLVAFVALLGLGQFFSSLTMPNFNAMAMEPLGHIAGTASSLIGLYTTLVGVALGTWLGQHYDGTVLPLVFGYLAFGIAVVAVVLVTERGRLFHPTHESLPR